MEPLRLLFLLVLLSVLNIDSTAGKLQMFSGAGLLIMSSTKCRKCIVAPLIYTEMFDPDNTRMKMDHNFIEAMSKKCPSFITATKSHNKLLDAFIKRTSKWCGNEDDKAVKNCCQERSKCPRKLETGKSIGGVNNRLPFTINGCECEQNFKRCLAEINNTEARKVYFYHFKLYVGACVINDHPTDCNYKMKEKKVICTTDKEKPKKWQIRDLKNKYVEE